MKSFLVLLVLSLGLISTPSYAGCRGGCSGRQSIGSHGFASSGCKNGRCGKSMRPSCKSGRCIRKIGCGMSRRCFSLCGFKRSGCRRSC